MSDGAISVAENLNVKNIVISNQFEITKNFKKIMQIAQKKKINLIVIEKDNRINIEKDLYIDIIWPNKNNAIKENAINNNSIVCKLQYNKFSALFTGDIEKDAENKIINSKQNIESTVLKLPHHGSKTSSTEEFLKLVNPQIVLIGVGQNNSFGHPNQEVIQRLQNMKIQIYRTDKMGEIELKINKDGKINIEKFCK